MLSVYDQIILFLLLYLCVYSIVNRICRCVENRSFAKAYAAFNLAQSGIKAVSAEEFKKMLMEGAKHGESGATPAGKTEPDRES